MASIAIIDDDPDVLKTIAQSLESAGYTCLSFGDAESAIKALANAHVDLVITDIYMPQTNGFELMETLRSFLPKTPIIAVSGGGKFSKRDILPQTLEFGANATLNKPFRRHELLAMIESLLQIS